MAQSGSDQRGEQTKALQPQVGQNPDKSSHIMFCQIHEASRSLFSERGRIGSPDFPIGLNHPRPVYWFLVWSRDEVDT